MRLETTFIFSSFPLEENLLWRSRFARGKGLGM